MYVCRARVGGVAGENPKLRNPNLGNSFHLLKKSYTFLIPRQARVRQMMKVTRKLVMKESPAPTPREEKTRRAAASAARGAPLRSHS